MTMQQQLATAARVAPRRAIAILAMAVVLLVLAAAAHPAAAFVIPSAASARRMVTPSAAPRPAAAAPRAAARRMVAPTMLAAGAPRERITFTVSTSPTGAYTVRGTYYASGGGRQESWVLEKTYSDFEEWGYGANQRLKFSLPPLPPRDLCTVLQLEEYLNKAIQLEPVWRSQQELAFFAVPRAVLDAEEDDATPTYKPDVYDVDGTPLRGEVRDQQDVKKAATIAGGVAGFFLGGPVGAMLGAAAANAASQREDGVGEVVKTAGKATNVAIRQVQKLDSRYDLSGKAKDALRKGFDGIKKAVDSLDEASSS